MAPSRPSDELSEVADLAECAQAAAKEAVAALSDDEATLEPPQDPRKMGEAHFLAATKLRKDKGRARQPRAILDLLNMAIATQPDRAEMYHDRAVLHMELGRDKEAVQDFTVALSLPGCSAHLRYQCLLFRGRCRMDVGDLAGADADYKAAQDAAEDDKQRREAQGYRGFLTMERVRRRKEAVERSKHRPSPVQHRYRTAVIEELEPEEGTPEQEEAVAQERAKAWEEAALSLAVEAKGRAARIAREYEEEQARVREENQARQERNEVRAARRRSVAEAAAARARAEARHAAQRKTQQAVAVRERTEIPIEVVGGEAEPPAADAGIVQTGNASDVSGSSTRSTASRLAGYMSESESTEAEEGQEAEAAAAVDATAEAPAPAADVAPAAAGQRSAAPPAEAEPVTARGAGAAAAQQQQQAAAQLPASAEAATAGDAGGQPAAPQAQAQAAPPEEGAPPLLSQEELDGMKEEADRLQTEGQTDAAEALYARYLRHRPADQRVWGNRAENCLRAAHWPEVLEFCNEALAIATPTHEAKRFKIFARRAAAYQGLGRLQEALRDYEAADAAAEAAGEWQPKKMIAKRIRELLAEMESKGFQAAPSGHSALGMRASAAAAAVPLPAMPVTPPLEPLAPQDEADPEGSAPAAAAQTEAAPGGGSGPTAAAAPEAASPAADARGESALSPGATLTAAAHQARIRAEEAAAAKQASEEAREKGNACFKRHQWEQALEQYRRASQLDPACKLALANQAAALLKLQRWAEAEDLAGQALAIDCGFNKARYRRALAYFNQGNLEMAVLDMELAAEADPADKAAQRELRAMKAALAQEQARLGLASMHKQTNSLFNDPSASE